MPLALAHPGVYIQELRAGRPHAARRTHVDHGVHWTSATWAGDEPVRIHGFGEYIRLFGGLWEESSMSYAVSHFFLNGGGDALIVRVHHESAPNARDRAIGDLAAEGGGACSWRPPARAPGATGCASW